MLLSSSLYSCANPFQDKLDGQLNNSLELGEHALTIGIHTHYKASPVMLREGAALTLPDDMVDAGI